MSLCVVHKPIADLFESPELNSPLVHQLLLGENLVIKKETENHYFIQTEYECYTGFVKKKIVRCLTRHMQKKILLL